MVAVLVIRVSWGVWAVARRRSRHHGVTQMPDEGGAEGGEDLADEGRMRCSCFLLRVDGGLHLSRPKCLDMKDRKDGVQAVRGRRVCPVVRRDELCVLLVIQLEPPCR